MSKSKPRFNIVDGLVVLAIIAALAAGVWYFTNTGFGDDVYVYFIVEFQEQMPDFASNLRAGETEETEVRDSVRNLFLGHVWDYEVRPAVLTTFDHASNSFVTTNTPDRYDVYVTIRGVGTENESSIQSNGQIVAVGQEMFIAGRGYAGRGFITQIWTTAR